MSDSTVSHSTPGTRWLRWNGLLLVGLGVLTVLAALTARAENWWSIFIFAPALVLFLTAAFAYGRAPRLSDWNVRINLSLGVIVTTVAAIFALGLDWGYAWTFMLIVPGLAFVLNSQTFRPAGTAAFGWARFVSALGLSIAGLGLTFLGQQLGYYALVEVFGGLRWWGLFILAPGLVAILGALAVFARGTGLVPAAVLRLLSLLLLSGQISRSGSQSSATVLLAIGAAVCAGAVGQFLGLHWAWQAPLPIFAAGLALMSSAAMSSE
ncbi:MAG: hypothetical protein JNL73_11550 [Anaerolineales bacterium]|nr:hypothetical protein [Anaerolineales bacterium]